MKKILLIIPPLAMALALSCKPAAEKTAEQSSGTGTQAAEESQSGSKDNVSPPRFFNFGQKTEYVMAMREQLTGLDKELDELARTIDRSSEAVQSEAKPKLVALREKVAKLRERVETDSSSTLPTWNVMKGETDKAFADVKEGIAQSREAVRDKVAP